jgi:hypothetical protein
MPEFSGTQKLEFCRRLGPSWQELADFFAVPPHQKAGFPVGGEARALWEWLELRQRLAELPAALASIQRDDLAAALSQSEPIPAGRICAADASASAPSAPGPKLRRPVTPGSATMPEAPGVARLVRFFESYAHVDQAVVERLRTDLLIHFKAARGFDFQGWSDRDLLLGREWHGAIQQALGHCDLGLLYVTPAFLASDYIGRHELPRLLAEYQRLVPILVEPIDFRLHDTRGLERRQCFSYRGKAYTESRQKKAFALELFGAVLKLLG